MDDEILAGWARLISLRFDEVMPPRGGWTLCGGGWEDPDEKARNLLLSRLDRQQKKDYLARRWFFVRGSAGGLYRIRAYGSTSGNVDQIREQRAWWPLRSGLFVTASLCAYPIGDWLPACDVYLAQMLMLKCDEKGFRKVAVRMPRIRAVRI